MIIFWGCDCGLKQMLMFVLFNCGCVGIYFYFFYQDLEICIYWMIYDDVIRQFFLFGVDQYKLVDNFVIVFCFVKVDGCY